MRTAEQLKSDFEELARFGESLTESEKSGPIRTVNQVIFHARAITLQMQLLLYRHDKSKPTEGVKL